MAKQRLPAHAVAPRGLRCRRGHYHPSGGFPHRGGCRHKPLRPYAWPGDAAGRVSHAALRSGPLVPCRTRDKPDLRAWALPQKRYPANSHGPPVLRHRPRRLFLHQSPFPGVLCHQPQVDSHARELRRGRLEPPVELPVHVPAGAWAQGPGPLHIDLRHAELRHPLPPYALTGKKPGEPQIHRHPAALCRGDHPSRVRLPCSARPRPHHSARRRNTHSYRAGCFGHCPWLGSLSCELSAPEGG